MLKIFYFFFILHLTRPSQELSYSNNSIIIGRKLHESILCRGCGKEITSSFDIISKISLASKQSFYDSIFNSEEILVQVLLSNYFFYHSVITTSHSTCVGIGEWEDTDTWFPGYQWRTCVCPDCGEYVGWIFEPIDPDLVVAPTRFFGLILSGLIGETFADSLAVFPTIQ